MIQEKLMKLHIKDRIVIVLMTISICSVLLCMAITTTIGVYAQNAETRKNLALNTTLLASRNAAALAFNNPGFSRDSLKLLKEQKNIIAGCILNKDGVFAAYGDSKAIAQCNGLPRDWRGFFEDKDASDAESVTSVRNIYSEGEWVGAIMLISNQQRIYDYLYSQLSWGLLIIAAVILASFFLARFLQGFISRPIMDVILITESFSMHPSRAYMHTAERSYEFDRVFTALKSIMTYANDRVQFYQSEVFKYASALKKSDESLAVVSQSLQKLDNATSMVNALVLQRPLGTHIENYEAYINDIRSSLEQYKSRFDAVTEISRTYEKALNDPAIPINIVQSITAHAKALLHHQKAANCSVSLEFDSHGENGTYLLHERAWHKLCEIIFNVLPALMLPASHKYTLHIGSYRRDTQDQLCFRLSVASPITEGAESETNFFNDGTITKDDFIFIVSCARYIANIDNMSVELETTCACCDITINLPNRAMNTTQLIHERMVAL